MCHANKMRKVVYILILLIIISFKSVETNDCVHDLFQQTDPADKNKYEKIISNNEYGLRNTIDSLSYKIIRRWTKRGKPIIESISNESTGIDFYREYNDKGTLIAEGYFTKAAHNYIGTWKYYSSNKKLLNTRNYDEEYKVTFCEFYKICETRELTGKTTRIYFNSEKSKWVAEKWTYAKDNPFGKGIELQVDSMKIKEIELHGIY